MSECLDCGENPIPHHSFWMHNSLEIATRPVKNRLYHSKFGRFIDFLVTKLLVTAGFILGKLGLIEYNRDITLVKYARARVLWEEAETRGIKMCEIKPLGYALDVYSAEFGSKKIYFQSLPRPEGFDESILDWIDDKWIIKQKLMSIGLPVPMGFSCSSLAEALEIFEKLPKPVVVKPRLGSRGRHTTTFVQTPEQLKQAFRSAKQLCHWVVVEEQLFGAVYRATIINNVLVGILGGEPPRITGDGKSTIEQLMAEKNRTRPERVAEVKVTPKLINFLARQNLKLDHVLPKKHIIDLSEKIGLANGGTSFDASNETHEDTKAMLVAAAVHLNNPIVGFDFIIPDLTKSYKGQKAGIIECNGAPFINLHYNPLYGETVNAARHVWDLIQK